jgi:beta-lactamase class A
MRFTLPPALAQHVRSEEAAFSGTVGLWAHDLRRRRTYGLRADEPFPAASTIKLFVLRELFRQVETGGVALADEVVLRRRDVVPGSGVLKDLSPGLRFRVDDAAMLMVTVSDNVATNLLIGLLGAAAINRGAREGGYPATRLGGKLFRSRRPPSTTSPRDLGALMLDVARGRAISGPASRAMLRMLRREQANQIVGRFLPDESPGPGRPAPPLTIASKDGSLGGARNDVAYVEGSGVRYVVALMSRGCDDHRYSADNEATLCLARIARAVHDQASGGA